MPFEHRHIDPKLIGVTHKNEDGTSRQDILKYSCSDERLLMEREPTNPYDSKAIKVINLQGEQLGQSNKELAQRLTPWLDAGRKFDVFIRQITGGELVRKVTAAIYPFM